MAEKKIKSKNLKNNDYKLVKADIVNYEHSNFDTVNYFENKTEFKKFISKCYKNLKKGGYLIFDIVTEEIFEEIFENGIFLDEEPEYTSIWRYEKKSKSKYFVEIDLFIRQQEGDNLFRKYNEQHNKFIYEPEWVVETVQKAGFEIFDAATNPDFGESRIFFIFKKI